MKDVYEDMEEAKEEFGKLAGTLIFASEFIERIRERERNGKTKVNIELGSVIARDNNIDIVCVVERGEEDGK